MSENEKLSPLAAEMVAGLSEVCDAIEAGEPIEKRLIIRSVRGGNHAGNPFVEHGNIHHDRVSDQSNKREGLMMTTKPHHGEKDGPDKKEMFYSASALALVADFKENIGTILTQSALDRTKRQGRTLVDDEDVLTIIDQLGWKIPERIRLHEID